LVVEAALGPPPIRCLFGIDLLPIALDGSSFLDGGFSSLVHNLGGIDHPHLLIPLTKLSFPLKLSVLLQLLPHLLLILLGLLFPNVIFYKLVNLLGLDRLDSAALRLCHLKIQVILVPANRLLSNSRSLQLLLRRP
jgi:hypothetical protein